MNPLVVFMCFLGLIKLMNKQHLSRATDPSVGGIFFRGTIPENKGIPLRSMRVLNSFALVYVYQGTGFYEDANGHRCDIGPGALILLFPGLAHAYGNKGDGWSEIFLLFDSPLIATLLRTGKLSAANPVHHLKPIDYWKQRLIAFIENAPSENNISGLEEMGRLIDFLGGAIDSTRQSRDSEDEHWLKRAQIRLETVGVNLHETAQALGTSYENFRKKFKCLTGVSPKQHHHRHLINHACHRLQSTDQTLESISSELGYCDPFHFSKQFKKKTGMSPREFRRLYQARLSGASD